MADTRRTGVEAWVLDNDGLELELASPGEKDSWVFVDLRTGVCYLENFRGPMSESHGLEGLGELLER